MLKAGSVIVALFFAGVCLLFIPHLCNVALGFFLGYLSDFTALHQRNRLERFSTGAEKRPECHNFSALSYRGGAGRSAPLVETLSTHEPHAKNSHPGARLVTTGSFSLILLFLRWSHSQTRSRKNRPVPSTGWASSPRFWVASEEECAVQHWSATMCCRRWRGEGGLDLEV